MRASQRQHAFTLVELLVVITIVVLLIALLLPALSKAKDNATRTLCSTNLHQVYVAIAAYGNDFGGLVVPWGYNGTETVEFEAIGGFTTAPGSKAGLGLLYPQYLASYKVLYCPSSIYMNYATAAYWEPDPYSAGLGTVMGYDYFAGIGITELPAVFPDNGVDVRRNLEETNRCVMGDTVIGFVGLGYTSSHPAVIYSTVIPEGGNFLFNDGHVRWSKCETAFIPLGSGWADEVFIDGQGWGISGKP